MYDIATRNGAGRTGGGGGHREDDNRDKYRRQPSNERTVVKRRRSRDESSSPEQRERKPRKSDSSSKRQRSDRSNAAAEPSSAAEVPPTKKPRPPTSPVGSPPRPAIETKSTELEAQTLEDLHQIRSPLWSGVLVLKKSAYPIQLFKLGGDDDLVDTFLRNERGESVQLNVSQRLKLDQPRTSDILKVSSSAMEISSYLLAVPNPNLPASEEVKLADLQSRPLKLLVKYFKEKDAAGVINVSASSTSKPPRTPTNVANPSAGVVYSFPKCPYADDFMTKLCPKLAVWQRASDDCLLMVLQRGGS